ncbi:nucleotidyltransferase domain-containing protein [Psychromonas hadalis]|uniref:nucleotidyltransferase domain-containing protein n=1 Tax=Psychromonas hadalis TaxID=211669 RepID=UPI0003B5B9DA|nr:nucleotidyltransferase domain-containing protein [Psychromonas hadalis]
MSNNGLSLKQQSKLVQILKKNTSIDSALLFGSRAMGTYKESSDIDIALIGGNLTLTDIANLLTEIELTTIPYQVDLLIKHKIKNKALIEHIEKYGIEFLSTD